MDSLEGRIAFEAVLVPLCCYGIARLDIVRKKRLAYTILSFHSQICESYGTLRADLKPPLRTASLGINIHVHVHF